MGKPAFFLDRDGVLNVDTHFVSKPDDLQLYPNTGKAICKLHKHGFASVVITNQSLLARNLASIDTLEAIHGRMRELLAAENAHLDAIYYCPHHPDAHIPNANPEYIQTCNCRKPAPGLIFKAADELGLDLARSYMVGDNERDILAGINAGCRTIGVKTGKGLKHGSTIPDYFFNDLYQAVKFITADPYSEWIKSMKDKISQKKYGTYTIRIGGNTQSGKTTLASRLRIALEEAGLSVMQVSLDQWLIPRPKRTKGQYVNDIFRLDRLAFDLKRYMEGKPVMVPGYARHPDQEASPVEYLWTNPQVLIVEGVPALLKPLNELYWDWSVGLSETKEELENRVRELYAWKGYDAEEINKTWAEKWQAEYEVVSQSLQNADETFPRLEAAE